MNNNIKILYNDTDLFDGISPTPFISINQDFINFNTKWNQVTKMTLNGQITGKNLGQLSFYELNSGLNLLVNRLSNNYGTLVINENSENLFSGNNVIIDSIKTDEGLFYGILPFTIDFEIYESGLFTEYYGVTDPEENIDFSEENGFIVNLTHSISAKGLKTGNLNAIESAKNWVKTRTGNYNKITPIFAQTGNGSNFLLQSIKETVNRFDGTYSWEGSYVKSNFLESPANAVLDYNLDISSGIEDGLITVKIDGSLSNNIVTGTTSNNLRSGFFDYNFYNIANEASLKTFGTTLNSNPITQSVQEEFNNQKLNFNLTYNSDLLSNITNNYNVDLTTDPIKNITTVKLDATIFGKYGDVNTRWGLVKDYYSGNFNAFNLANTEYKKEITGRSLYSQPLTESITFNEYGAEIKYTASWSDKRKPFSDNVITMKSSLKYNPSISIYVPKSSITQKREHNIQDINCANLAQLELNISAVAKPDKNIDYAISEVNSELQRIKTVYNILNKNYLLEKRTIKKDAFSKIYEITENYSYQGDILI